MSTVDSTYEDALSKLENKEFQNNLFNKILEEYKSKNDENFKLVGENYKKYKDEKDPTKKALFAKEYFTTILKYIPNAFTPLDEIFEIFAKLHYENKNVSKTTLYAIKYFAKEIQINAQAAIDQYDIIEN